MMRSFDQEPPTWEQVFLKTVVTIACIFGVIALVVLYASMYHP